MIDYLQKQFSGLDVFAYMQSISLRPVKQGRKGISGTPYSNYATL